MSFEINYDETIRQNILRFFNSKQSKITIPKDIKEFIINNIYIIKNKNKNNELLDKFLSKKTEIKIKIKTKTKTETKTVTFLDSFIYFFSDHTGTNYKISIFNNKINELITNLKKLEKEKDLLLDTPEQLQPSTTEQSLKPSTTKKSQKPNYDNFRTAIDANKNILPKCIKRLLIYMEKLNTYFIQYSKYKNDNTDSLFYHKALLYDFFSVLQENIYKHICDKYHGSIFNTENNNFIIIDLKNNPNKLYNNRICEKIRTFINNYIRKNYNKIKKNKYIKNFKNIDRVLNNKIFKKKEQVEQVDEEVEQVEEEQVEEKQVEEEYEDDFEEEEYEDDFEEEEDEDEDEDEDEEKDYIEINRITQIIIDKIEKVKEKGEGGGNNKKMKTYKKRLNNYTLDKLKQIANNKKLKFRSNIKKNTLINKLISLKYH
jgi:hypothetical protein